MAEARTTDKVIINTLKHNCKERMRTRFVTILSERDPFRRLGETVMIGEGEDELGAAGGSVDTRRFGGDETGGALETDGELAFGGDATPPADCTVQVA